DKVMQAFRLGYIEIMIATDVAARGIDVENVEAIINFDLPQENEIYVHRIGRTGRAGKAGLAITLATTRQAARIREIEAFTKSTLEMMEIPTAKQIEVKSQKLLAEKILKNIEDTAENHTYDNLLMDLARKTTDPMPIIIRLLEMLDKKENRAYPAIETVRPGKRSTSKPTKATSKWCNISLNLGSRDKLRPNQLVSYLHDVLTIHREHIGKIIIEKDVTYIEVKEIALPFLKTLNDRRYLGKKLNYKKINRLPRE
ncbi:MAG: DbpA RNA binding domain-containing protein, partial [Anaeroplasmataceae bacterium]|nr:DbpA RNA binding domain-containing protein [Anaeroplasmataceae bacterium]